MTCQKKIRRRLKRQLFSRLFDEAGDGLARLRAFANPVFGAVEVDLAIVAFFQRLIRADFLDEPAIARTAAVGNHNAEKWSVLGSDALHSNFYCHKFIKRTWRLTAGGQVSSFKYRVKAMR